MAAFAERHPRRCPRRPRHRRLLTLGTGETILGHRLKRSDKTHKTQRFLAGFQPIEKLKHQLTYALIRSQDLY